MIVIYIHSLPNEEILDKNKINNNIKEINSKKQNEQELIRQFTKTTCIRLLNLLIQYIHSHFSQMHFSYFI